MEYVKPMEFEVCPVYKNEIYDIKGFIDDVYLDGIPSLTKKDLINLKKAIDKVLQK